MQLAFSLLLGLFCLCINSAEVNFSPERGFYNASFELNLTLPSKLVGSGAVIRYFLYWSDPSGPDPTSTTGTVYTKPIKVERSCYVIAIAFIGTKAVTDVETHSYLFPEFATRDPDTDFSPSNLASQTAAKVMRGLVAVPAISLTSLSPYPYPLISYQCIPCMVENERPVRVEWIDPAHPKRHWINLNNTYDIYGTSSRGYRKKNIKLSMVGSKIRFDFFSEKNYGVHPVMEFKEIAMRAHSQDGPFGYPGARPLYMKNHFQEYVFQDAGLVATHGRVVNVFYNSHYQGMMHLREKLSKTNFWQSYFGAEDEDYEAIGGDKWTYGGRLTPEEKALFTTYTAMRPAAGGSNYAYLNNYLDWDNWFTFSIMQNYACNADLDPLHNVMIGGSKKPKSWFGKNSGWKYQVSGPDHSFAYIGDPATNCVWGHTIDHFNSLVAERHPDFLMRFADHQFHMLAKPNALLSANRSKDRFQRILNDFSMDDVIAAELFRWGYTSWSVVQWRAEVANVMNSWITNRHNALMGHYTALGLTSPVSGVLFSVANGAIVPSPAQITVTSHVPQTNALVYYTINGQDPRLPGGAPSSNSSNIAIGGSISLTTPTKIMARIRSNNGAWGPINDVLVNVGSTCVMCKSIIFTEISYQPAENKSSFVEIKNIGTQPVIMTGATIKGFHDYVFPVLTLQPGHFFVIGNFMLGFPQTYKKNADDFHIYHFERKGEQKLTLKDQFGNNVHELVFSDIRPWSKMTSGTGYTVAARPEFYNEIALSSAQHKNSHFQYWRHSALMNGSPWKDDPLVPERRITGLNVTFVDFHGKTTWVELRASRAMDLSDWILTRGLHAEEEYVFPKGTMIAKGGSLKVKDLGFNMKSGDKVVLFQTQKVDGEALVTGEYVLFDPEKWTMALN